MYFHRIEFIFLVLYTIVLPFKVIVLARLVKDDSSRFWPTVSLLFPAAAVFDFVEDVLMLLMLSEPYPFPLWTAVAHSFFALIKLSFFFVGLGVPITIVISVALKINQL